jgi:hypothetical protein
MSSITDTADVLRFIDAHSTLTGSVAYGSPTPADHDRFCTHEQFKAIRAEVERVCLWSANANADDPNYPGTCSMRVEIGGVGFNIFAVSDDAMSWWGAATAALTAMARVVPEIHHNKRLRVHLFIIIKETLRAMTAERTVGDER